MKHLHLACMALLLSAAPLAAQEAEPLDPYATVCKETFLQIDKDSIDGSSTLVDAEFLTEGQLPTIVDPTDPNLRVIIPPPSAQEYKNAKVRGVWHVLHFLATHEVMNDAKNPIRGLHLRSVMLTDDRCQTTPDMPYRFAGLPQLTMMNIALNQKLLRRDGTYNMATPQDVQELLFKTPEELTAIVNAHLVEKLLPQLTQPGDRQSNEAQKPR